MPGGRFVAGISTVALNVDLDIILTVWAQAAYDALRRRPAGYETVAPETICRRFLSTPGTITLGLDEVVVRLRQRTCSLVLRSADHPVVTVPR